jgi:transposase
MAGYSRVFKSLVAPIAYKGFTNTQTVINWLEDHLIPNLKQKSIETGIYDWVIVMDNAAFNTSLKIRKIIEDAGYKLLFLSPYSPDFNPIEHQWFLLKLALASLRVTANNFYDEIHNQLLRMSCLSWG